ncbi:MAG: hypothetical protein COB67_01280 [SAR324 cluster bacterium]|uniref:Peptidyl-prolyl cis-trans isomerase n=1 Tax=SAR324 cluster bacterium TaxID=2024889 RepID=A0A2A4TB81_9DELT|nr:MAG: hypothetical protein COB67_01280 [SAR324 cluster bacterium]
MKLRSSILACSFLLGLATPLLAETKAQLTSEKDRVSYTIGYSIGDNFNRQSIEVTLEALMSGVEDALQQNQPQMSPKEMQTTMENFGQKMRAKMATKAQEQKAKSQATAKVLSSKNIQEGSAFLSKNKQRKAVVTLPSGLQYEVLRQGAGKKPTVSDTVETHYRGTLINGTEFDSSYSRGKSVSFPVNGVIKGWTEALQLMNVGSKWKLFIPADLAYGNQGTGQKIAPGSTLIFEIELLNIK